MAWQSSYRSKPPLLGVNVPGRGPTPAFYMVVGERPGKQEPASGLAWSAAAGAELARYLRLASINCEEEVYRTYLVKDYLDIPEPTENEILRDLPILLQEIEDVSPVVLILCGRVAIRHFLGDVDVEQVHGLAFPGTRIGHPDVQYVYPVYSPTAGLHSGDNVPPIHHDFLGLRDLEGRRIPTDPFHRRGQHMVGGGRDHDEALAGRDAGGDVERLPVLLDYRRRTGTDVLEPSLFLGVDSEGDGFHGKPWSLQFSQSPGVGRIVYATEVHGYVRDWNYFWSAGGRLLIHNSLHDISVFRAMGLRIRRGQWIDTMLYSYLLCTEPQGLKALAYRIAGMEMDSYADVTSVARQEVQMEWLAGAEAVAGDIGPPELELVWDDKKASWRVKQPQPVATRIKRIYSDLAKGKTVDIADRVSNWEDSAAGELREICGEVPEPTLNDIPAVDAEFYACRDADATVRVAPYLIRRIEEEGLERVAAMDHAILPMIDKMQTNGILINPDHFRELDLTWTKEMDEQRDEIEGLVGVRINPSSPDQVSALLFKQLGLPSRKLTKGGEDSTQDKVLEGIRHMHPVLPMIMNYRELDKMRGSFCRKMLKLAGPDNRVRGNIRVTRTASGRLAMNSPNLMAIPVRMARGRQIREGFIAAPGNVIGNWDLDQIEMREIADVSGDEFLHELFSDPSRDIHAETAGRMFDKDPATVDPKTERYAAKRVGFGIATQITGAGLVDQMELAGARHADGAKWTADECDHLIELWFGVYPGVRKFIDRTKAQVRRTGVIRDRWGRMRHLQGIWSTIDRIRAEAERQGPSHVIQAGAQGVMKQNMARIDENLEDMPEVMPLLQIHDSLMLEYPEEMHPLVNEIVMDGMENTVKYTVPITASGEYGYSWGKMELGED